MADFRSISAAGQSLEALLSARFAVEPPIAGQVSTAKLIQTNDLENNGANLRERVVSILLYRVDFNKPMRASWSAVGAQDGNAHLPVDLHYLLTAWAKNPVDEHLLIGRTMQIIEEVGALSGSLLWPTGSWAANEAVQLYLEDIGTDDLVRTFESLTCDFRLSIPYLARIVVISTSDGAGTPEVLTHVQGLRPDLAVSGSGGGS